MGQFGAETSKNTRGPGSPKNTTPVFGREETTGKTELEDTPAGSSDGERIPGFEEGAFHLGRFRQEEDGEPEGPPEGIHAKSQEKKEEMEEGE